MTAIVRSLNPIKLAARIGREANPVRAGKALIKYTKNTGSEEAKRAAIEAGKGFAYWFGGLIGIAVGVLNPMLMHFQYKKKGVPAQERNALVVQEAANQAVNVVVHMMCYFGLSALVGKKLAKIPGMDKDAVDIWKIVIANIGGFLGQGVVRPILGSTILMKWKENQKAKNGGVDPAKKADESQQGETPKMQSAPSSQDQELEQLLKMLEQQGPQQAPPQQAPAPAPQPPLAPPPQAPAFPPAPPVNNFAPPPPAFPAMPNFAPPAFGPQLAPQFAPMTPPPPLPPVFPQQAPSPFIPQQRF